MRKKLIIASLLTIVMTLVLIYQCFYLSPRQPKDKIIHEEEAKIESLEDSIMSIEQKKDSLLEESMIEKQKGDSIVEVVKYIEVEKVREINRVKNLPLDSGILTLNNWLSNEN